jgi:non-specific serine/threonine protein kinase
MGDLSPGTLLAGYRIDGVLGRGGMGVVYRATQLKLERTVALKVIAESVARDALFRERFRREALAAAAVEHPHVVPLFEADERDGVLFLAMRLIAGQSLAEIVIARGPLEPARAVRLVAQVASALDAAHARGVVHRDVKPANVLVSGEVGAEHAYLTDFGIANQTGARALTATGVVVGSLDYMAPEILRGGDTDHRVDVYALGCTLYEAMTGEVPFNRDGDAARISAHLFEPPPSPREHGANISSRLDQVVRNALAKRPDERPQRAGNLGTAALAAVNTTGATTQAAAGSIDARNEDGSALAAPAAPARTNLRGPAPALIGRGRALEELVSLGRDGQSSIVTVTGPGGVGKTSLAIAAGHRLVDHFVDGVFLIELEAVSDPEGVAGAIGRALSLPDAPGVAPLRRVADYGRDRRMLLVLDNFEHVLDAAGEMAELVATAPLMRLLVTSQAPLHVAAERVFPLRPLELPDGAESDLEALAEVPSVALLLKQAQRLDPDIAVTRANAAAIAELCTQLDGLPLALELAAARLAVLSPGELLERLGDGLDALGRGGRDVPSRHGGLRATLDWTTSQLSSAQRTLLMRLAVFLGGFTIQHAEVVGDADVLDDLALLRDLSLMRRDSSGRFSIPPPVRIYELEALRQAGAEEDARARHADAMLALVEVDSDRWLTDFVGGMRALTDESANLRAALRWTHSADADRHARLAVGTAWWLRFSGHVTESARELDAALKVAVDPPLRARLLLWRDYWATVGLETTTPDAADFGARIEACRELGDEAATVVALYGLANIYSHRYEGEASLAAARQARVLAARLEDPAYRELADLAFGIALEVSGDPEGALAVLGPLVTRARPGSWVAVLGASNLADAALTSGDATAALAGYCGWLRDQHAIGSATNDAFQLDGAAMALAALGRYEDALVTAALSDQLRAEYSFTAMSEHQAARDAALAPASEALGPSGRQRCESWAASLGVERGIAWVASLPGSGTVNHRQGEQVGLDGTSVRPAVRGQR